MRPKTRWRTCGKLRHRCKDQHQTEASGIVEWTIVPSVVWPGGSVSDPIRHVFGCCNCIAPASDRTEDQSRVHHL
jgi:hypothetical protein